MQTVLDKGSKKIYSREELAWAAGFFDGEGNIGLVNSHNNGKIYKRLILQIGQCDKGVLERFQKAVGVGNINGPYKHSKEHHTPYWQYCLVGFQNVQAVFALLYSWLSAPKRKQGEEKLNAAKEYHSRPREPRKDKGTKRGPRISVVS